MALFDYLISDDLVITLDADFIQTTNHSLYFWVATPYTTIKNCKAVDEINQLLDELSMRNGVIGGLHSNQDTYNFINDQIWNYSEEIAEMLMIRAIPACLITD